jgi:hypothetical protein
MGTLPYIGMLVDPVTEAHWQGLSYMLEHTAHIRDWLDGRTSMRDLSSLGGFLTGVHPKIETRKIGTSHSEREGGSDGNQKSRVFDANFKQTIAARIVNGESVAVISAEFKI